MNELTQRRDTGKRRLKRGVSILVALGAAAFLCGEAPRAAAQLVSYDFNSLTSGALTGQGVWMTLASQQSPTVLAGPTGSLDTTQVVGAASSGNGEDSAALFSAGSLTASSVVTLEFQIDITSTTSNELFGLGNAAAGFGPSFGVFQNAFVIKTQGFSATATAVNSSGANVTPTLNHWYEVMSVWDLSANSGAGAASFYIEDLTAGASTFTQLFFNQAQTSATGSLGINTANDAPSTWTTAYLRTASGGSGGYLDNLSATVAVPEPRTGTLGATGLLLLGACLIGRRRRARLLS